jgi:DMSO/TMAO reductase YedYZ heme-binding membrane subunit
VNPQFWWYVARATGLVAWALATGAVLWGLFLHTRALGKNPTKPWLLDLHRYLGGLTVLFVLAHMGALVADSYAYFGVKELFVPMASPWQPGAVAWGIVAFYGLLAVEVTSLLMRRIPKRIWLTVHLTSYLTFVLATVHGVVAGTDMGNRAGQVGLAIGLIAMTYFVTYRQLGEKKASPSDRAAGLAANRDRAMHARHQARTHESDRPTPAPTEAPAPAGETLETPAPPALTREERIARAREVAAAAKLRN